MLEIGDVVKTILIIYLSLFITSLKAHEYKFNGIVKLAKCSGSLIRFEGQPKNSHAYVLTNGHCLGKPFISPGESIKNKPFKKKIKIFNDKNYVVKVFSKKIMYATMTITDIALLELSQTYDELSAYGIEPFHLDTRAPSVGTKVEMLSGYKNLVSTCSIEEIVPSLQESKWFFKNSLRYSEEGCVSRGGTSGSPLVAYHSRKIVAINNTRNVLGLFCKANNPCEINVDGKKIVRRGASYGQQTSLIYTCLDKNFIINTQMENCLLPR